MANEDGEVIYRGMMPVDLTGLKSWIKNNCELPIELQFVIAQSNIQYDLYMDGKKLYIR